MPPAPVMVRVPGVVPELGDTESQLPPLLVEDEAVKLKTVVPSLLLILTVWLVVPPAEVVRFTLVGEDTMVGAPRTLRVTGTTTEPVLPMLRPLTVMDPV